MRFALAALGTILLLLPASGHPDEAAVAPTTADIPTSPHPDATACMSRNLPEPDMVRAVRIISRDRDGNELVTRIRISGRRGPDHLRKVRVDFLEPQDVAGARFVLLEREGPNEMYFQPDAESPPVAISDVGRSVGLLGSDISYEDFEHLMGFRSPAESRRREDEMLNRRAVYVLESVPSPETSAYSRMVTFVDKATCVPLKTDLYQDGARRKTLTVNHLQIQKRGDIWIPGSAVMQDLVNYTSTVVLVDRSQQEDVSEDLFEVGAKPAS